MSSSYYTPYLINQFIAYASHVYDSNGRIAGELAAKFGDEDVEAAGVEIAVVAP